MNIAVRKSDDVVIVDFEGRLAAGVSDGMLMEIVADLLTEGYKKILLNLSMVDYIDSNGLGELVQSLKASRRADASLHLLQPQERVRKTLKLTNLLPMFPSHDTELAALNAFATEAAPPAS